MQVGSIVRVKENVFEGSDDPADFEARGKIGEIVMSLEQQLGEGWNGCWEVCLEETGDIFNLTTEEIEIIEAAPNKSLQPTLNRRPG